MATRESEIGYHYMNTLIELLDEQHALAAIESVNGGTVALLHRPGASFVLYRCDDAAAWGTMQRFTTTADANNEYARILDVLNQ